MSPPSQVQPVVPSVDDRPKIECPGWCAQVVTSIFGWQRDFERKFDQKIGELFGRSEDNRLAIAKLADVEALRTDLNTLRGEIASLRSWRDKSIGFLAAVVIVSNVIGCLLGIMAAHFWR